MQLISALSILHRKNKLEIFQDFSASEKVCIYNCDIIVLLIL